MPRLSCTRLAVVGQARGGIDPLWRLAGSAPAVDFDFSSGSMLDKVSGSDLITYTRPSTAWGWNGSQFVEFANDVPRIVVDPATGLRGLLVEEARTNLLLNSDTLSTQTVTVAASQYTLSFYGTGTVTLSGASTAGPLVGTGAAPSRVSLTFTPSAGSLTLTVSGSVRFAQLELGAFPTSPIITTGSALTRSADVAAVTGANFSSWFNASAGTVFARAQTVSFVAAPTVSRALLDFSDGTTNNRMIMRHQALGSTNSNWVVRSGASTVANLASGGVSAGPRRMAAVYALDDYALSSDGSAVATNTSGDLPVGISRLDIGSAVIGEPGNLVIPRVIIWPARLPDATLQALTAP